MDKHPSELSDSLADLEIRMDWNDFFVYFVHTYYMCSCVYLYRCRAIHTHTLTRTQTLTDTHELFVVIRISFVCLFFVNNANEGRRRYSHIYQIQIQMPTHTHTHTNIVTFDFLWTLKLMSFGSVSMFISLCINESQTQSAMSVNLSWTMCRDKKPPIDLISEQR